jgi:N-acyl-D-amino-acid deacylase
MQFDVVIKNARVIDPETGLDEVLNVGAAGGKIAAVTREDISGREEIDGAGCVLAPGFIDIHTHEEQAETVPGTKFGAGEPRPYRIPRVVAKCLARCGVTTVLGGNCGGSNYPIGSYLEAVKEANLPTTCLTLVGAGTLREQVGLGNYDEASPAQILAMSSLALRALDEGAAGISFGLQYAPGTSFSELAALAGLAAERGKFFAVHMRYDMPGRAVETVKEVLAAAKITGAALQISHYAANVYGRGADGSGNIEKTSRMIEDARASGLDVAADMYPYDAWATGLKSAVFDNGFDAFTFGPENRELLAGPLAGQYCTMELFEKLRADKSSPDMPVACHGAVPEEDLDAVYRLPWVSVGSDAIMAVNSEGRIMCHPRAAGTPARFLRVFYREKKLLSLPEAVRRLTLLPAQRLGLAKKGRIQEGCDAYLCLFDPETIADRADYAMDKCALPPVGVKAVIAGGVSSFRGKEKINSEPH